MSSQPKEQELLKSIKARDKTGVESLINNNPGLNLNCQDEDDFTPLHHACHLGDIDLVRLLLVKGADINLSSRKDGYTPLMLAALGNRIEVVKLLLENGVDTTALNCVNRTAFEMAAFVGLGYCSGIINCWLPYKDTIEPFTRCMELEDKPRITSLELATKLHEWIVSPSLHPIKILQFVYKNPILMRDGGTSIYVMDQLSSRYLKPQLNSDSLSLKFHYLGQILRTCKTLYEETDNYKQTKIFTEKDFQTFLLKYMRRLNSSQTESGRQCQKPKINDLILRSIHTYPYNTALYQSINFALSKLHSTPKANFNAMVILTQSICTHGVRGLSETDCEVCGEGEKNKKCASCKKVYYCGLDCQNIDWPRHKNACRPV